MLLELALAVVYVLSSVELVRFANRNYEVPAQVILSGLNTCEQWTETNPPICSKRTVVTGADHSKATLMMNHFHGINLYVIIFSVLYLFRLVYIALLIQWNMCGGGKSDTAKDRFGLVLAMNALLLYHLLQIMGCTIVLIAYGSAAFIWEQIISFSISFIITVFWRQSAKRFWQEAKTREK